MNVNHDTPSRKKEKKSVIFWDSEDGQNGKDSLVYAIDDTPPWYLSILLGLQHYLTMTAGTISIPYLLSSGLCITNNTLVLSQLISSILFCSGIITLVQTTVGVRLPIVQGGTFSFLAPTIAILALHGPWLVVNQ